MSTAALFVEALDTLWTLIQAAFGWLIFFATVAAILVLAATACCAWAVDAMWEWVRRRWRHERGVETAREPDEAPPVPQKPGRRTPSWAHTQPIEHDDIEEAA